MKANELRLGNIVQFWNFQDKPRYVTVNARFFSSLSGGRANDELDKSIDEEFNNYWSGIQLTHEILEKCGFKKRRDGEYLYSIDLDKHISIVVNKDNFFPMLLQDAEFSGGELNVYSCNLINYLHQLQNLYFAITGEELEVKL